MVVYFRKKRASAPNAHSICIEGVEVGIGDKVYNT